MYAEKWLKAEIVAEALTRDRGAAVSHN